MSKEKNSTLHSKSSKLYKYYKENRMNEISVTKNGDFQNIVLMIKKSQQKAYSSVNHELIDLYFNLGKYISLKVEQANWGKGVVKELADYIAKTAPELTGFSDKNLWRMKQFYEIYRDDEKLSPLVRELSWTNNLPLAFHAWSKRRVKKDSLRNLKKQRRATRSIFLRGHSLTCR